MQQAQRFCEIAGLVLNSAVVFRFNNCAKLKVLCFDFRNYVKSRTVKIVVLFEIFPQNTFRLQLVQKNNYNINAFHCVFKVKDIEPTRKFIIDISGSEEGKSTEN